MELTPKQQEVFDYVVEYRKQHGYSPSRREIGDRIGKGAGSAQFHLLMLEEKGCIKLVPGMQRGIKVLSQKSDREEFEEWSKGIEDYYLDLVFNEDREIYYSVKTNLSWMAWQAARSNQ